MSLQGIASESRATSDAALIATNDDAFESKVAAMRAGYFKDEALATMAEKYATLGTRRGTLRRPPVINRGTYARVLLKETLVEAFLTTASPYGKMAQIISIGAGFDTQPFALVKNASRLRPFHYVELDFADVVREKTTLASEVLSGEECCLTTVRDCSGAVQGTVCVVKRVESVSMTECTDSSKAKGMQFKNGGVSMYSTRGVDVRDLRKVEAVLEELGVCSEERTLVVAEIMLVYMETEHSDALIRFFSGWLSGVRALVAIEPTGRDSEFGKQMAMNIAARGSALRGLEKYPNMESQERRLKRLGWANVSVESLLHGFERRVKDQLALNAVESLDETEEWCLIMSHYCVMCATAGLFGTVLLQRLDVGRFSSWGFRKYESEARRG